MKSVTEVTKTKTRNVKNNRKNGKRYEGELVKVLRQNGISARLGRSNEEGDVILPSYNIVIEAKSTNMDRYRMSKSPEQFFRLGKLPLIVFFGIRYKGDGLEGWRFYPLPGNIIVLHKDQGLTLREFVLFISGGKFDHQGQHKEKDDKIPIHDETGTLMPIKMPNRRVAG